jgi:hypothetical protein
MISSILPLLLELTVQGTMGESPTNPDCAAIYGAFCIVDAGMNVDSALHNGGTRLTIYAWHSPEQAARLSFSNQCLGLSNASPRLVGYSPYDPADGRIYLTLIFKVNDECFLTLSAPSFLDRESNLGGLSISLGLVRLCQERPCSGTRLMDVVPMRFHRAWFSRRL